MRTRRAFVRSAVTALCTIPMAQACSSGADEAAYEKAARETWRHQLGDIRDRTALQRELVRYATLAPSSHNTQCWRFHLEKEAISILPDLSRRCPAVDPDDHHLFVSLGCATENLVQTALANGFYGEVSVLPTSADAIRIELRPTRAETSPLFQAIPERQCTRAEFDGRPVSAADLALLEKAGAGNGVRLLLLTGKQAMDRVLEFVVQGNAAQIDDPAFFAELKTWLRFSRGEAVRTGDGLFAGASGNPVMPSWLGHLFFRMFFTAKRENAKYVEQVRSSAGIAVFVADVSDKAHWVEVGRCYERFALQATALGIRNSMLNQPIEVAALRPQFAASLGLGALRPDLVVRFGRGATLPKSLRRPVEAVLV